MLWCLYAVINIEKVHSLEVITYKSYGRLSDIHFNKKSYNEERSQNHRCRGKSISIKYSQCVSVALITRQETRMRRIILSSVACPAVQYFSKLFHTRHNFPPKKLLNIKCAYCFPLQFLSKTMPIVRIQRDTVINIKTFHVKYQLFSSEFNKT